MSFKIIFPVLIPLFVMAFWVYASNPWLGKTLSADQVKQRWGQDGFDPTKFRDGDQNLRARMAFSLITSEKMIGLSVSEVREKLGKFDGHYFSESFPTYLIQTANKKGEESWQIVFLIDAEKKTKEIIVHKNCCD
jgi:hypothetical protein